MINFSNFYKTLGNTKLADWFPDLDKLIQEAFMHGDFLKWKNRFESLPKLEASVLDLSKGALQIGSSKDHSDEIILDLENKLREFHPWRKGPYNLFGINIDTEWRSDLKWNRLKNKIHPLTDRKVLDIGCGNGYHCWRMYDEGAKYVIGIDPYLLSVIQFYTIKNFIGEKSVWVLPAGIEDIPGNLNYFDTVFSMGVFYHRRSPLDHLYELQSFLRNEGQLVLETLVIDGKLGEVLVPEGRYAQMRNVWFLPSCLTLESWLKRCGYKNIQLADVTKTTSEEQRKTDWMKFLSLKDFLDPNDENKTIEGYPAPMRAIFTAEKK
ncbi:MAG: tRNA 5-methoxyuridine(34)/uridine 5-oxyacetic acid(34) synthase CmoB [Melioribacteraceae bacterium]|nr:tRNA 5-methoxyuridine(34)/uridine 5-oxyacetic acid(34) synthase CmoB [Melioribacteraceae bacterium]